MLAEWIISTFPPHHVYVEPFCGGAAVFFRKHRSPLEVINDLDGDVINFFDQLRSRPDALLRAIRLTPWSRAEYNRSHQIIDSLIEDPVERARRFYVCVWQSFGGNSLYNSGWRVQKSIAVHTRVVDSWRRMDGLEMAAERLKDAQIDCRPAGEVILQFDTPDALFYVDPPYLLKSRGGSHRRYTKEMCSETEHRDLAGILREVEGMVVLSGYNCPLYAELYGDWTRLDKSTTTSGNSTAVESLWLNPAATDHNKLPLFAFRAEDAP